MLAEVFCFCSVHFFSKLYQFKLERIQHNINNINILSRMYYCLRFYFNFIFIHVFCFVFVWFRGGGGGGH